MGIIQHNTTQPTQPQDAKAATTTNKSTRGKNTHKKKSTYEVFPRDYKNGRRKKQNRRAGSRIHR